MEKLIAELMRLFIPAGALLPASLAQRLLGDDTQPLPLVSSEGLTRVIAIRFDKTSEGGEAGHWTRLCEAANALQAEHGFPAPAVSVTGSGYCLWISLEAALPLDKATRFAGLLHRSWFPGAEDERDEAAPGLPPFLDPASGRWAAFIHPGMGASFADEPWLDMAPPPLAQAAFLESIESVSLARFERALQTLQGREAPAAAEALPAANPGACAGLLLKDATLEDIVRHLHARNIEPTFRHLIARAGES